MLYTTEGHLADKDDDHLGGGAVPPWPPPGHAADYTPLKTCPFKIESIWIRLHKALTVYYSTGETK